MEAIEYWIQLETRPWAVCPNSIDRMTGQEIKDIPGGAPPEIVTLTSPVTNATRSVTMFKPLREDGRIHGALILRRYTANWAAPDDRKVNPWDLNEPDPTDTGTMGTIPGPVIECNVGDQVIVHFRNLDMRLNKAPKARAHSMHVHGFVFEAKHDAPLLCWQPETGCSGRSRH